MLEILDSQYVVLARAKGVNNRVVIWKHAFKNAMIVPLTFSGLLIASYITGTVVTETVFGIPGLGRLAVDAVFNNDFPVITGVVLIFTLIYVVMNLLVDIAYAVVDPRIRY
jgi:peptide/nickel transport system permease protein